MPTRVINREPDVVVRVRRISDRSMTLLARLKHGANLMAEARETAAVTAERFGRRHVAYLDARDLYEQSVAGFLDILDELRESLP